MSSRDPKPVDEPDYQFMLGYQHLRGGSFPSYLSPQPVSPKPEHDKKVEIDLVKSFHYFKISAESNQPQSLTMMGKFYLHGGEIGVPVPKSDPDKSSKYFLSAAKAGDTEALVCLGDMYYFGDFQGFPKNLSKAMEFYTKAAKKGDIDGLTKVGILYKIGPHESIPKNYDKAIKNLKKAADSGGINAAAVLAGMFYSGIGMPVDFQKAFEYYKIAADRGDSTSQYNAANLINEGKTQERNMTEAAKYYEMAAKQGISKAMVNLGLLYCDGQGVIKNSQIAAKHFSLAANQNDPYGFYHLARRFELGDGTPKKSMEKAIAYYRLAAESGIADAYTLLGIIFLKKQNFSKAFEYHKLALKNLESDKVEKILQNYYNPEIHFNLGLMFRRGEGTEQDFEKAFAHFELAAQMGFHKAQFVVGDMYELGEFVKQDTQKAREWFAKCLDIPDDESKNQYKLTLNYVL